MADEEKIEKIVKQGSKASILMKESEKLSKEIDELGLNKKDCSNKLLDICIANDFDKLIFDDEGEKLLTASKIKKITKSWDDKAIIKTLTSAQKKKVVTTTTKTITTVDYEELISLFEAGEIEEEVFATMFKEAETTCIQVGRVKRK